MKRKINLLNILRQLRHFFSTVSEIETHVGCFVFKDARKSFSSSKVVASYKKKQILEIQFEITLLK